MIWDLCEGFRHTPDYAILAGMLDSRFFHDDLDQLAKAFTVRNLSGADIEEIASQAQMFAQTNPL